MKDNLVPVLFDSGPPVGYAKSDEEGNLVVVVTNRALNDRLKETAMTGLYVRIEERQRND